ncbi:MAG TPA: hypothetical protein VHN14_07250 [Kofleriaceae bacterium]|jgi:hypothetical protein|nr:hypothetical protein [Kofleriaceae bacterium]
MLDPVPSRIHEYADQAVSYVQRALGIKLEYDSDTLPVLDHYLRTVPDDQPAALQLVVATSGAYFGEVVRQRLGGRWELGSQETEWRIVLPTGINFSPVGFVAAAIAQADLEDLDSEITAPPRMLPYVQQALARMGEVSIDDYYSLCGRLDTIEHLHEVLVAVAAQLTTIDDDDLGEEVVEEIPEEMVHDPADALTIDLAEDLPVGAVLEPLSDDPSGPVN